MSHATCTCASMPDGFTCPACTAKPRKTTQAPKSEQAFQRECVAYFRRTYPDIIITSIRNELQYDPTRKHIGVLANRAGRHAGIADLVVLRPMRGFGALFVELKTPKGRQSDDQIRFAAYCVRNGYMYALARNIDEFRKIVQEYLQ